MRDSTEVLIFLHKTVSNDTYLSSNCTVVLILSIFVNICQHVYPVPTKNHDLWWHIHNTCEA